MAISSDLAPKCEADDCGYVQKARWRHTHKVRGFTIPPERDTPLPSTVVWNIPVPLTLAVLCCRRTWKSLLQIADLPVRQIPFHTRKGSAVQCSRCN